ncbi:GNAT family N-acetyltransferase [Natrarchaeobius halalkaliphilus]|uniref:GNAT family N-acetyltransferase n=1 Tax=Natrarchaeobius halalkaliphilus TaxID=1679091 RepID=A0A3N6LZ01_9EURY|nr:GNAT family N-acetyltransferase [Natrarchaeobius halalkaliphilus]RQG87943.1 GNAT family N-acetyltransferase [Natrarchaeobius halalkaliphilus]
MNEYTIRHARPDDADDILDLWYEYSDTLSTADERYQHKDDAGEQWRNYFLGKMTDSSRAAVHVADSEEVDGLLGVIEVRIMGAHPIFQLSQHGAVFGHHVRTEHRGNGIEEDLLEEAERWFTDEHDLPFYRVNVLTSNDSLVDLYREYGLDRVETTYEGEGSAR